MGVLLCDQGARDLVPTEVTNQRLVTGCPLVRGRDTVDVQDVGGAAVCGGR